MKQNFKYLYNIICIIFAFNNYSIHTTISTAAVRPGQDVQYSTSISQANVALGKTFVISLPGTYILSENIAFTPVSADQNVIEITSDDVRLDLNAFSIRSDKSRSGTVGVFVDNDVENVQIINGTISGMTGNGIEISSGCQNLKLFDLFIADCDTNGILANGLDHSNLTYCNITKCNGLTGTTIGLNLQSCQNLTVQDCTFSSISSSGGNSIGMLNNNCINCRAINCNTVFNEGNILTNGFSGTSSISCIYENCTASNNVSTEQSCSGFSFTNCTSLILNKCKALTNVSNGTSVYGFQFQSSNYNTCSNCKSQNNSANNIDNAYGFFSNAGVGNKFINCHAIGNIGGTAASSFGVGFNLEGEERYSSIINCESNINTTSSSAGIACGIKLGSSTSTAVNCVIRTNKIYNNNSAQKFGFIDYSPDMTSLLSKNVAFGQGVVKPLDSNGQIIAGTAKNYYFTFVDPSTKKATYMILETDITNIQTIDTASPWENISIWTN